MRRADCERSQRELTNRRPLERDHGHTDRRKHSSNLSVLSFRNDDPQPRTTPEALEHLNPCGPRALAASDVDAPSQRLESGLIGLRLHQRFVGLLDVALGVRECLAETVVVREDQQPGGVLVETADRENESIEGGKKVVDGLAPRRIGSSRDHSDGLVERENEGSPSRIRRFATQRDPVVIKGDAARAVFRHVTVDGDVARFNVAKGLLARAETQLRKRPGKTDRPPQPRAQTVAAGSPSANVI